MPRDLKVCGALQVFFQTSIHINILSHPKSMSQHHSGSQNSEDPMKEILY